MHLIGEHLVNGFAGMYVVEGDRQVGRFELCIEPNDYIPFVLLYTSVKVMPLHPYTTFTEPRYIISKNDR